jgi:hypothetical protein
LILNICIVLQKKLDFILKKEVKMITQVWTYYVVRHEFNKLRIELYNHHIQDEKKKCVGEINFTTAYKSEKNWVDEDGLIYIYLHKSQISDVLWTLRLGESLNNNWFGFDSNTNTAYFTVPMKAPIN